jgi:hypothetical protein
LYNQNSMPEKLLKAHKKLDSATVEEKNIVKDL